MSDCCGYVILRNISYVMFIFAYNDIIQRDTGLKSGAHTQKHKLSNNLRYWTLSHYLVPAGVLLNVCIQLNTYTPGGSGAGRICQCPAWRFPERLCPFGLSHFQLPPEPESVHCQTCIYKNTHRKGKQII